MRTIAHISDLHFGRHDQRLAEALIETLERLAPDLVVVSGDLTQRARSAEFAAARRFVERVARPKVIIPGNHDIPLYDVLGRMFTPTEKYDRYIAPLGVAGSFFTDAEIAVLGLNTARRLTGKNGRVSHDQVQRLCRLFREVPQDRFKILATHHPLRTTAEALGVSLVGRSPLTLRASAAAGVQLLLSGHYHVPLSGHVPLTEFACSRSILVVHAGTAISTRTRRDEPNSFNLLRIDQEEVSVTVMEGADDTRFRSRATITYRLDEGHWRRVPPIA